MRIPPGLCLLAPLSLLTAAGPAPIPMRVSPFEGIQLQAGDSVEIVRGPTSVVLTRADPGVMTDLSVETVDGVLRIGRKPEACRMPKICVGNASFRISTPRMSRVTVQGSGDVRGHRLGSSRLSIVIQGSGDVRLDGVESETTEVELDGTGAVELAGRTNHLSVSANGRGSLDATALTANDGGFAMNGGGSVRAHVIGMATIDANGGGSARITGTRECRITRNGRTQVVCGDRAQPGAST